MSNSFLTRSILDGGQRGAVEHQDKELRARRKQILEPQWPPMILHLLTLIPNLISSFSFERSSVVAPEERFGVRVEYDLAGAPAVAEDVLLRGGVGVVVFEGANRERHLWKERGSGWERVEKNTFWQSNSTIEIVACGRVNVTYYCESKPIWSWNRL